MINQVTRNHFLSIGGRDENRREGPAVVRRSGVLRQRRRCRRAFSLLEVLLTMAMAVVLMALINWAFDFYVRDMNISNDDIEQTQIAAAVLQMIENDLRATLHPIEVDMTPLEDAFAAISGDSGGGAGATDTAGLAAAGVDPLEDDLMEEEETPDLTSGVAVLDTPGLIGNQTQIQIDVSRLPRIEEYYATLDAVNTNIDDVPSDIKTVAYFVQPPDAGGVQDPMDALNPNGEVSLAGGLVRRSLDRSVTKFAALNGSIATLNQTGEILAPEVVSIQFEYWDGIEWLIEWSSDELEELPLAVRVTLSMANPNAEEMGLDPSDESAIRVFTHIIRLQLAIPIEEEEEVIEEEAA